MCNSVVRKVCSYVGTMDIGKCWVSFKIQPDKEEIVLTKLQGVFGRLWSSPVSKAILWA